MSLMRKRAVERAVASAGSRGMSLQELQAALLPTAFSEPYGNRKTAKQMIRRFADQLVQEDAIERRTGNYVVKEQGKR